MTYKELLTCELVRFYFSLNPKNELGEEFKEEAFNAFGRLVRKAIPAGDLAANGLEFAGGYDDMCVDGYSYGGDDFTLYFDDYFIDEEDLEYTDADASPVGIVVSKGGFAVLGENVVIGKPVDIETVDAAIDGSMNGKVGYADLGEGYMLIECAMQCFDLVLTVRDGILESAMMLAIAMPC